jgi:hypothetical protein
MSVKLSILFRKKPDLSEDDFNVITRLHLDNPACYV